MTGRRRGVELCAIGGWAFYPSPQPSPTRGEGVREEECLLHPNRMDAAAGFALWTLRKSRRCMSDNEKGHVAHTKAADSQAGLRGTIHRPINITLLGAGSGF